MFDFLGLTNTYLDGKFMPCSPINMYDYGISYISEGKTAIGFYLGQHKNHVEGSEYFGFINLSGRGCRLFESYSKLTFKDLFEIIHSSQGFQVSRLDIALDIKDKDYPMSRFVNAYNKDYYVCSARKQSHIDSKDDNKIHGHSLYFGNISSDFRINIYDKRAERGYTERELPDGWIRIEVRLRHQTAMVFLERYINGVPIGQLYFGVLSDKLRFVTPSKTDSNKRRWKTAKWWRKIIQDNQSVHLELPGVVYDLGKWEQQLFLQCGSRLKLAYQIYTPWQLKQLVEEDKSIKLNTTQQFLLDNYMPGVDFYEI